MIDASALSVALFKKLDEIGNRQPIIPAEVERVVKEYIEAGGDINVRYSYSITSGLPYIYKEGNTLLDEVSALYQKTVKSNRSQFESLASF